MEMTTKDEKVNPKAEEVEEDVFANAEKMEIDPSDRMGGTGGIGTKFVGLAQNAGTNVQKLEAAGKFFTKNDEGELIFFDDLKVIMLESQRRATRFVDNKPVCKSYGGLTGPNGEKCSTCEYSSFIKNSIPSDDKCRGSYVVLCVNADDVHGEPFFLQIAAGAIADFKKYASELQNKYKRTAFSVVTKVTSVRRDNGHGSLSFVPVFKGIKILTTGETAGMRYKRVAEFARFSPIDESTPTGAAMAQAEAATSGDRDPFVEE
jgi:hypothetical protein